jgi:hypothetical protein
MKLDVLCSSSDWAFVMAEADALESEDPTGCIATALRRTCGGEARRYGLVAAELMRRAAVRRAASGKATPIAGPEQQLQEEDRAPEDCKTP